MANSMIPAVAYYRMSSDRQETSIDDQREAVEKYASENAYKIIREYRDEGVSGWKSEQRKGFQKLITDADGGDFQAVLCWDQDRFSRFGAVEANYYWHILSKAGVHIATVAQGRLDFEDLGEWLKHSITQHGKAEFCRDLARNTARGLRKVRLAGQWSGRVPFGYRLRLKQRGDGRDKQVIERLELGDPDDIATVRRIFDMRARGIGLHCIAKQLNADGVTTPRGNTWHAKSIHALLLRPVYRGHSVIGVQSHAKYEKLLPEPTTIENTHPAIIDQATWDAVQAMPKMALKAHSRNGSEGAPLSGLLTCGRCGSAMHAATVHKSKYYLCSRYHNGGGCGHCHVDRDSLLQAVATKLREKVLMGSPEKLERAIQKQLDRKGESLPTSKDSALPRKLAKLDAQIERAARRILDVDDSIVGDVKKQLVALRRERDSLAGQRPQNSVEPPPKPPATAKAIAASIWQLLDRILCEASPMQVRAALKRIVASITLDFEPAGQTGRGRRFRFAGGTIRLSEAGLFRAQKTGRSLRNRPVCGSAKVNP